MDSSSEYSKALSFLQQQSLPLPQPSSSTNYIKETTQTISYSLSASSSSLQLISSTNSPSLTKSNWSYLMRTNSTLPKRPSGMQRTASGYLIRPKVPIPQRLADGQITSRKTIDLITTERVFCLPEKHSITQPAYRLLGNLIVETIIEPTYSVVHGGIVYLTPYDYKYHVSKKGPSNGSQKITKR